jgi:hypothetical protein
VLQRFQELNHDLIEHLWLIEVRRMAGARYYGLVGVGNLAHHVVSRSKKRGIVCSHDD